MITVIIPTYKSPAALDLCLQSAINGQAYANQILVVVDGYIDLNMDVLKKYAGKIDILDLETNQGLCRATNMGVYNAKFDNILIINDDNVLPLNYDVKLLEAQKNNPHSCITPNQIEPYDSMFNQFVIADLGRKPETFDLEKFYQFEKETSSDKITNEGSTLPIFMKKIDYLRVGGWDENYELGVVSDWDFFLKCELSGMKMIRTYNVHVYHFVSLSTNETEEKKRKRSECERNGQLYAKYKWGSYIYHDPITNSKRLKL